MQTNLCKHRNIDTEKKILCHNDNDTCNDDANAAAKDQNSNLIIHGHLLIALFEMNKSAGLRVHRDYEDDNELVIFSLKCIKYYSLVGFYS